MPLKKRSVAIELRLRAEAEARKEAAQKLKLIMIRFATGTLTLTTLLALVAFDVLGVFCLFSRIFDSQKFCFLTISKLIDLIFDSYFTTYVVSLSDQTLAKIVTNMMQSTGVS